MPGKKILLTVNPDLYNVLENIAKENYMTMQELVSDTLRKRALGSAVKQSPEKNSDSPDSYIKYFSRKR